MLCFHMVKSISNKILIYIFDKRGSISINNCPDERHSLSLRLQTFTATTRHSMFTKSSHPNFLHDIITRNWRSYYVETTFLFYDHQIKSMSTPADVSFDIVLGDGQKLGIRNRSSGCGSF